MDYKTRCAASAALVLLAGAGTAGAFTIGFDAPLYSATGGTAGNGELVGQPAQTTNKWTQVSGSSGNNNGRVTAGDAVVASQAWRTSNATNTGTASTVARYVYNPTNTATGDVANADYTSDALAFSFTFTYLDAPVTGTNSATVLGLQIGNVAGGGSGAVNLFLRTDGRLTYNDGGTNLVAKLADLTTDFVAVKDTSFTVAGELSFATSTMTLSVNTVAQPESTDADAVLGLGTVSLTASNRDAIRLSTESPTLANFRAAALDDIVVNAVAVPEPVGVALCGVAVAALVRRRYGRRT